MTEMAESPVLPGVLWVGTDDGNVQVSKDGGLTFTEVGKNIPGVNHSAPSQRSRDSWFDAGTAASCAGPDIAMTTGSRTSSGTDRLRPDLEVDIGRPAGLRQRQFNPPRSGQQQPLCAPTEIGFYISLNDGQSWTSFMPGLPTGRVDEVLVHPREHDLVLATHSRSIWIMDDITPLQQMATATQDATLFKPRDAVVWKTDRRNVTETPGDKLWQADPAPRGTAIAYTLKEPVADAKVTITDTATGRDHLHMCWRCPARGCSQASTGLTGRSSPVSRRARWPGIWRPRWRGRGGRGAGHAAGPDRLRRGCPTTKIAGRNFNGDAEALG